MKKFPFCTWKNEKIAYFFRTPLFGKKVAPPPLPPPPPPPPPKYIRAGVEKNPGPSDNGAKWHCVECKLEIKPNSQPSVQCTSCDGWTHFRKTTNNCSRLKSQRKRDVGVYLCSNCQPSASSSVSLPIAHQSQQNSKNTSAIPSLLAPILVKKNDDSLGILQFNCCGVGRGKMDELITFMKAGEHQSRCSTGNSAEKRFERP